VGDEGGVVKPETRNPKECSKPETQMKSANRDGKPYNLEERTALFGECIIAFAKRVVITPVTRSLINQVVRSATSIGANYCEADDSESKKDFLHKIRLCRKESRETKHWLRMIAAAEPELKVEA
jgi:four helix bundle protein